MIKVCRHQLILHITEDKESKSYKVNHKQDRQEELQSLETILDQNQLHDFVMVCNLVVAEIGVLSYLECSCLFVGLNRFKDCLDTQLVNDFQKTNEFNHK